MKIWAVTIIGIPKFISPLQAEIRSAQTSSIVFNHLNVNTGPDVVRTLKSNLTVLGDFSITGPGVFIVDSSLPRLIQINGNYNQEAGVFNGAMDGSISFNDVNLSGGTFNQGNMMLLTSPFGGVIYNISGGTFNGGNQYIELGDLILSGGVFNAGSGLMRFWFSSSGTPLTQT